MSEQENPILFSQEDIEKNKVVSALAYIGILFFLPLVASPESQFGRFHANQGLILFLLCAAGNFVLTIIPIIGWILIVPFDIVLFVFAIMGLVNTLNGKAQELPIVGKIKIIR